MQQKEQISPEQKAIRFIVTLVIIVLAIGALLLLVKQDQKAAKIQNTLGKATMSPSPIPFYQMTIPYLRSRSYQSTLGQMDLYATETGYTSYLTSYTSDGLKINALLTKPAGVTPKGGWPAIVFIHGYIPPMQYVTTEKYIAYVDYLARQGFVVFKIDLRGHGQSEGKAGGGYFGSDYVTDALNAYAALQGADFVNPKQIGLWGHSMAGNIVLRSMVVKPEIPASVIWAGAVYSYVDQRKYGINDQSYHPPDIQNRQLGSRRELYEKYGSPSAQSVFWQQVAPTSYLADLKGAIEIHHAQDDDVVNIGYSRDLIAFLDKTKVPHALYEYPTGGHNIQGESFDLAMERTAAFFHKYLDGKQ